MMEIEKIFNNMDLGELYQVRKHISISAIQYHINGETESENLALEIIEIIDNKIFKMRKNTISHHGTLEGYQGEIL